MLRFALLVFLIAGAFSTITGSPETVVSVHDGVHIVAEKQLQNPDGTVEASYAALTFDGVTIFADEIIFDPSGQQRAHAKGNVILVRGNDVLRCFELKDSVRCPARESLGGVGRGEGRGPG